MKSFCWEFDESSGKMKQMRSLHSSDELGLNMNNFLT